MDDDDALRRSLEAFFSRRAWFVSAASTGEAAIAALAVRRPDIVLLDFHLPDVVGFELILELRQALPDAAIIVMTGDSDVTTAVNAIRGGAEDFITKPMDLCHLEAVVERALEKVELRYRSRRVSRREPDGVDRGRGTSPAMLDVTRRMELVAPGDTTVLLLGESGVGKGWMAEHIHALSGRDREAFVETNCAGLSATFLDSELFGHEKGAFTDAKTQRVGLFETAHCGTLFLDEIGDLSPELQPKLLKVLEKQRFRRLGGSREIHVDVRLIAATNRDLSADVKEGRFREDLFYRLAVVPIRIPSLRERGGAAIVDLALPLFANLVRRMHSATTSIQSETLEHLSRYDWPGNVRELKNVLERGLILAAGAPELCPHHLPPEITGGGVRGAASSDSALTLRELERLQVRRVMELFGGNKSKAAESLGISRVTLYDKIKKHGLANGGH